MVVQQQAPVTDTQAYAVLKAVLPVCHADLTSPETGVRGLVASKSLQEGQTALLVPDDCSLSVSTGGAKSVGQWQKSFLGPWQAAHGRLPTSLTTFLADTRYDATVRISAWLLHLKKHLGSAPLWRSWLSLLPPSADATSASGFWTPAELQQLQLEPYKGVMSAVNAVHADVCSQAYDHLTSGDLAHLHLATSAADVMWGSFIVRTRASSHGDRVTLRPVHDLLNHAQSPNAVCSLTEQGYAVEALTNIPAGAEITISYTGEGQAGDVPSALDLPPEPATPSLELFMTWGFTLGVGTQDQIFPLQYQALPGLEWDLVLTAAAAAMKDASGGQGWAQVMSAAAQHDHKPTAAGKTQGPRHTELLVLLQAAVANLPIAENGAQGGSTASALFSRAADTIDRYGMPGSSCCAAPAAYSTQRPKESKLQFMGLGAGAAVAAATSGLPPPMTSSFEPIDPESTVMKLPAWAVFARSYFTQLHLQQLQADLVSGLKSRLSVPTRLRQAAAAVAAALIPGAAADAAALPAAPTPGMPGGTFSSLLSSSRWDKRDPPLQLLVATALLCEVQFTLLSCGSSLLEDVAVLKFLQRAHAAVQTAHCSHRDGEACAAAPLVPPQRPAPPHSKEYAADAAAAAARLPQRPAHAYNNSKSGSSACNTARAGTDAATSAPPHKVVTGGGESQPLLLARLEGQQAVESFQSRQQDILQHLMLLQAQALEQLDANLNPPALQQQLVGSPSEYGQGLPQHQPGHKSGGQGPSSTTVAPAAGLYSSTRTAPPHLNVLHALHKLPQSVTAATAAASRVLPVADGSAGGTARYVARALSAQQQQIDSWRVAMQQREQQMYRGGVSPDAVAVAEVTRVLSTGQASKARLEAAVRVRLQHKQLLEACAVILQEVQRQVLLRHDQVP